MVREGSGHLRVKDTNKQVLDLFSPGHTGCTRTTNDEQEYGKHEEHTVDSQMYIKLVVKQDKPFVRQNPLYLVLCETHKCKKT